MSRKVTMTQKEIDQYWAQLVAILQQTAAEQQYEHVQKLALEVGASIWRIHPFRDSDIRGSTPDATGMNALAAKEATMAETVQNIHHALQTATMIDMCRTANRDSRVTLRALRFSVLSMIAAWVAAVAAWVAAIG